MAGRGRREVAFAAVELSLVVLVVAAGLRGWAWPSTTPWLLAVGWLSLASRRRGWGSVGLERPHRPLATVVLGVGCGLLLQAASLYLLEPAIARWIGAAPDLGLFGAVEGDLELLGLSLALGWTLIAVGEELVYRGYLLDRLAELAGGGRRAWGASLMATSALFGLGHAYQGVAGIWAVGLNGLAFGALYLATGRNLWAPIVAHGTVDSIAFVLLYLGRYPGVGPA